MPGLRFRPETWRPSDRGQTFDFDVFGNLLRDHYFVPRMTDDVTPLPDSQEADPGHPLLGLCLVLFGVVGLLLSSLSSTHLFPFPLPAFWFEARAIFLLLFVVSLGGGSKLIWQSEHGLHRSAWRPTWPGRRFHSVILYTRPDCPLCEEAKVLLARYSDYLPEICETDINADRELVLKFGHCVPVVEIDRRVRFRGRISEVLLQRLIEATPPWTRNPGQYGSR